MRTRFLVIIGLLVLLGGADAGLVFADTIYSPPKIGKRKIDRCVNDGVKNNCNKTANRIAANEFCKVKGHPKAVNWRIDTKNIRPLRLKRAAKTLKGPFRFIKIAGIHAFTTITCKSDEETRRFSRPTKNGQRIDNCVQGADWGFGDPQRCDSKRKRQIATKFCLDQKYKAAKSFKIQGHIGNHAILTFPKGKSFRSGVWTQVAGVNVFKEIICKR